jgi:hypothetical protein
MNFIDKLPGRKGKTVGKGRLDSLEQTQGKANVRESEPKIAKQHFYAIARGRDTGVFLSWEEAEVLVKNFSGARHHRFDTVEEAMQYLDDFDHQVILTLPWAYRRLWGDWMSWPPF